MSRLVDASDRRVLLEKLEIAKTFWSRFLGLQFRRELSVDAGLLLAPCSSIHTCFMRFPIDVYMLNSEGYVVGFRKNVRPWRVVFCVKGTKQIVETGVGAVELSAGVRVQVVE